MSGPTNIQIVIAGKRGGQSLSPANIGVGYLIELLGYTRDLLSVSTPDDPVITIHEGSLLLSHESDTDALKELSRTLRLVSENYFIGALPKQIRRGLRGLQKITVRHGDAVVIRDRERQLLAISSGTKFTEQTGIWVASEKYVHGMVTNAGGISNPNIHIQTDDPSLGTLLVSASEIQLAEDDKNRLYKPVTLRVAINENTRTGELDLRSARLLDFVDVEEIRASDVTDYVDQLIGRARASWSQITDKESWLAAIRGHEG